MKFFPVIVSILIAETAGLIGSLFTADSVAGWYIEISKPAWNPPSWIFGPVWVVLYALMGIAAFLVWQQKDMFGRKFALWVYGVHLVLNALWSILFFGLKNPGFAFFEIIVLFISILITTVLFWRINLIAGLLMIPYIAWVSFATFLNYTIWHLN